MWEVCQISEWVGVILIAYWPQTSGSILKQQNKFVQNTIAMSAPANVTNDVEPVRRAYSRKTTNHRLHIVTKSNYHRRTFRHWKHCSRIHGYGGVNEQINIQRKAGVSKKSYKDRQEPADTTEVHWIRLAKTL